MSAATTTGTTTDTVPVYVTERNDTQTIRLSVQEHNHVDSPSTRYDTWVDALERLEDQLPLADFQEGDRVAALNIDPTNRRVVDATLSVAARAFADPETND